MKKTGDENNKWQKGMEARQPIILVSLKTWGKMEKQQEMRQFRNKLRKSGKIGNQLE